MKVPLLAILLAALVAPAGSAPPQGKEYEAPLSYREAIQLALQKNFSIEGASYDPLVGRARLRSAQGKFDPALTLSYTRSDNTQDLTGLYLANGVAVSSLDVAGYYTRSLRDFAEANLGGLTPWGMTYEIGATLENQRSSKDDYLEQYTSFAGISVTQPLLRGFGTGANMASIRLARADAAISAWAYRAQVIDIVTRTTEIYNELWFSAGNAEVEKRSRELAVQLAADNRRRAEVGVMSKLDVLQAETDVAAREERVLVAERQRADNENFLKQLVTNRVEDVLALRLQISPPPRLPGIGEGKQADLVAAMQSRPDFRQALLELQKRQINVVFARNQALPQLDLVASFGSNGIDREYAGSFSRSFESRAPAWSVGGAFSIPIPNRTALGTLDAAKLEVARQLVELKRLEQAILVEADNAAGQVDTASKRIEASRAARILAAETLAAGETKLRAGTSTTFEVLQFQRDLALAEIAEIRAMADYNIAVARYQRATGTTLGKNGIVLAD